MREDREQQQCEMTDVLEHEDDRRTDFDSVPDEVHAEAHRVGVAAVAQALGQEV
jgi:hypothetical protein